MAKIRIGKNVGIRWRITTNGEDVPLEGRNLTLFIRHPYMQQKQLDMRVVDGNVVAAVFRGVEQHYVGVYTLTLYEDYGLDTQNITDRCDAFELVRCSCEELTTGDLSTTDIEVLVSDYIAGVEGLSAYEVAVKNGFVGSEAEWLDSLVLPAEQAAEETRQLITKVTEAENERTASEETRQINESTREQQETSRVAAEEVRVQAETKRVQAEQQRADEFAGFTDALAVKEDIANKVTSINADADDVHYPSAKAVYEVTANILKELEDKYWYGIEKDFSSSSPTCTRIGNMDLHRTLPVHSLMRGCLLADDGTVNKYLDPNDWTSEVRDGSQGQVMVELPKHYKKFEWDGNILRVKLSLLPLDGFHKVPKMYVSAYEAALNRRTNKLCSVVNEATDYRGGDNSYSLDGTYKSQLGMPATWINRENFRTYARKRGSTEWNCYTYDCHVNIWWLYVVEYATINSQSDYNEELTAEGYRQGGLGEGLTNMSKWNDYNSYMPVAKCGLTDYAGNRTTQLALHLENDEQTIVNDVYVPRYRGIEHPFGHSSKIIDGIISFISPTAANGGDGTSKVYVCSNPDYFNDSDVSNYRFAGLETRDTSYIKLLQIGEFGDIVPTLCSGASSSTYYCDSYYTKIPTKAAEYRMWIVGGNARTISGSGFMYVNSQYNPRNPDYKSGTRLCFIPKNN